MIAQKLVQWRDVFLVLEHSDEPLDYGSIIMEDVQGNLRSRKFFLQ
jgi:hypothetical protein